MTTARLWRALAICLGVCLVPLFADQALSATQYQAIDGNWIVDLNATTKENLRVYFGGDDGQEQRVKAASLVLTFDSKKMKFLRQMPGKKEMLNITQIETKQRHKWILWFAHVTFPDYIETLANGRLRYGSDWGEPWEFILQREDACTN